MPSSTRKALAFVAPAAVLPPAATLASQVAKSGITKIALRYGRTAAQIGAALVRAPGPLKLAGAAALAVGLGAAAIASKTGSDRVGDPVPKRGPSKRPKIQIGTSQLTEAIDAAMPNAQAKLDPCQPRNGVRQLAQKSRPRKRAKSTCNC
jgi:hypothetical protein